MRVIISIKVEGIQELKQTKELKWNFYPNASNVQKEPAIGYLPWKNLRDI